MRQNPIKRLYIFIWYFEIFCYSAILLFCYSAILLFCYSAILLFCYSAILLFCYSAILLFTTNFRCQATEYSALFDVGLMIGFFILTVIGKGKSIPNNNASP
nr:hypothetical protein [Bathymodiolus platifrons methanotrophic gill symbiont]